MLRRSHLIAIIAIMGLAIIILTIAIILLLVLRSSSTDTIFADDDGCNIPPDFWCLHPDISSKCETTIYCNRQLTGQRMQLTIAFESLCNDSQSLIVERLYPRVLNQTNLSDRIDIQILPWGGAKRDNVTGNISCTHGIAECHGNLVVSCVMAQDSITIADRYRLFYCIEATLHRFPWHTVNESVVDAMRDDCCRQNSIDQGTQSNIQQCIESDQGVRLQADAETQTNNLAPSKIGPRPWITFNNRSIVEMQAYQMMLAEKLTIWIDDNEHRSCQLPPDFWCDHPDITGECFDAQLCKSYFDRIAGRPIRLTIVYNVDDRELATNVLMQQFVGGRIWNDRAMQLMVRIRWLPRCLTNNSTSCYGARLQECIHRIVDDQQLSSSYVVCHAQLLSIDPLDNDDDRLFKKCANKMYFTADLISRIQACASGDEGNRLHTTSIADIKSMSPDQPTSSTPLWLVINDMSSQKAQVYQSIVDQLICVWYRAPGHDRKLCARCLYEATWCTIN